MRLTCISVVLLVLGGCASQGESLAGGATAPVVVANSNEQLTPQTKVVCHKESSTGSQMIHSVCETEQTAAERQATQDKLLNTVQSNAVNHQAVGAGH